MNFDALDEWAQFECEHFIDSEYFITPEEVLQDALDLFQKNPPPGISPIKAEIVSIGPPLAAKQGLSDMVFRCSIRDFITSSIEYDEDPYKILKAVHDSTKSVELTNLARRFLDEYNGFRVAQVGMQKGKIHADNWPTNPKKDM